MTDKQVSLQQQFPNYLFEVIPADDVRTKNATRQRVEVIGLLDKKYLIREIFKQETINIFEKIRQFFQR